MRDGQAARSFGVEVVSMTKRFGDFVALHDVSLKVGPGSCHALLGENGAGKSTLVKCMMGYYQPDAGAVIVAGREQPIANPHVAHALGLGPRRIAGVGRSNRRDIQRSTGL